MRILSGLSIIAVLALAAPAAAQDAPAPQAPAPAAPNLNTAAPKTPAPEGVSTEADQALWCGHAFSVVSEHAKQAGDQAASDQMAKAGTDLIARGSKILTDGGFSAERVEETKSVYAEQIGTELQGDGSNAKFSYEECTALVQ